MTGPPVLVVTANRLDGSFGAAITREVVESLRAQGRSVTLRDLYATGFDPVPSRDELAGYRTEPAPDDPRRDLVAELQGCSCLVLIYPTWWFGMPAVMKGYIDRLFLPGVAISFDAEGRIEQHGLSNIRRFAAFTSYGFPRWRARWSFRDPGRSFVLRGLRDTFARDCKVSFVALYGMDHAGEPARRRFLDRVRKVARTL